MQTYHILLVTLLAVSNLRASKHSYTDLEPHEARRIAIEAYIYGYSLVTSEITRVQMTNSTGYDSIKTPMGVFNNVRTFMSHFMI